jgi:hypothetical protein
MIAKDELIQAERKGRLSRESFCTARTLRRKHVCTFKPFFHDAIVRVRLTGEKNKSFVGV